MSHKRPEDKILVLNDETEEHDIIDCANEFHRGEVRVVQDIKFCAGMRLNEVGPFM